MGGGAPRAPSPRCSPFLVFAEMYGTDAGCRDVGSRQGGCLRATSKPDYVPLHRQRGFEAVARSDLLRQWLATLGFTVRKDDLRLRGREVAEPFQQFALTGVGAEAVEGVDLRFHGLHRLPVSANSGV